MATLDNGLKFLENFDNWATADAPGKWTDGGSTIGAYGRNGTSGLRFASWGDYIRRTVSAQSQWVLGTAFRFSTFPVATTLGGVYPILSLRDVASTQCSVCLRPDGTIGVYRDLVGTLLTASTFALRANTYYFIEWPVTIGGSAAYAVWVNGVQWLTGTGNTQSTGNASANGYQLGANIPSAGLLFANVDHDDFYECSGSSATRLGDSRPLLAYSSGAGFYNDFTPNPNVAHNLNIDDTTPDGDSTYNDATAAGQRDSYLFSPTITGPILGVQVDSWVRNTDSATTNFNLFSRISGTNYDGGTVHSPNTTFAWFGEMWENSPASSVQWTSGEIAEFGMHRTV